MIKKVLSAWDEELAWELVSASAWELASVSVVLQEVDYSVDPMLMPPAAVVH